MKRNAGRPDRIIRVVLGLALLSLIFIGPKTMFGLIGLVPLTTGLIGYCPLYQLMDFRTCQVSKSPADL